MIKKKRIRRRKKMNNYFDNTDIYLRALEPEDMEVLYKWENDTSLWRDGGSFTPYSRYVIREYIANSIHDIYDVKQLRMMIIERESEAVVGTIDLYDFDSLNRRAGIGILIDKEYQQRGYALQALDCIERYAFGHLNLHQIFAHVSVANETSLSLFAKAGYEETARMKDWLANHKTYMDVILFQKFDI